MMFFAKSFPLAGYEILQKMLFQLFLITHSLVINLSIGKYDLNAVRKVLMYVR